MKNVAPAWAPLFKGRLQKRQEIYENEIRTGKRTDGTVLREAEKQSKTNEFLFYKGLVDEFAKAQRVYPNRTYRNKMTLGHGGREFLFLSVFGDAEHSTTLYLPKEKILLVGDLLVYPIQWGANGYHLTDWMNSLKMLNKLNARIIIPGHGPAFKDKIYLNQVTELFEIVISEVRTALARGLVTVEEVQEVVKLDAVRLKFTKENADLNEDFREAANHLIKMAYLEARDGMESKH